MPAPIIAIRTILVAALLLSGVAPRAAEDEAAAVPEPVGVWRAELERGEKSRIQPLQLLLRIRRGKEGFTATLDAPALNLRNQKLESLFLIEDVLSFQVAQVQGRFAGNFYGDSLRGIWSQGEESWPLIFSRDLAQ
jgi:hypothetical protein